MRGACGLRWRTSCAAAACEGRTPNHGTGRGLSGLLVRPSTSVRWLAFRTAATAVVTSYGIGMTEWMTCCGYSGFHASRRARLSSSLMASDCPWRTGAPRAYAISVMRLFCCIWCESGAREGQLKGGPPSDDFICSEDRVGGSNERSVLRTRSHLCAAADLCMDSDDSPQPLPRIVLHATAERLLTLA